MSSPQNVIAVIFDFDDTLTDDSTTRLLEQYGIDSKDFWKRNNDQVKLGWDPTLSYLSLLLENVGDGRPFGRLSNRDLREFGESLEFYSGIPQLFDDLRTIADGHRLTYPKVEFYVISGGIEEIIAGSSIAKYLSGFRGCRFAENPDGVISRLTNVVSFTDKTRYIFEINKGILGIADRGEPYRVNEVFDEQNRRIPVKNMIYLGDGLTDVPCFSLVRKGGGTSFGIFDPRKIDSPKKAWENLIVPHRVGNTNSPKYGENDDLGALLRAAIKKFCLSLDVGTRSF